jgi:hypothetical protein
MRSKKQHPNKVLAKNKSTEKFTSYIQVEKTRIRLILTTVVSI